MQRLLFLFLLILGLPFALVACAASDDDDDDSSDDDDMSDDDDDDDDDDDVVVEGTSITGTVQDPAGTPLEGISLTVCSEQRCLFANTDASGGFQFDSALPDAYVIHNISVPGSADDPSAVLDWSSFYDIVTVEEADIALAAPLVVPEISESYTPTSGANTAEFSNGVTVGWEEPLAPPLAAVSLDDITVGITDVPEANWPEGGLGDAEILRVVAFSPFELALEDDDEEDDDDHPFHFNVRISVDGLDPADSVSLAYANYDSDISTGVFSTGEASVSPDGATVDGEVSHLGLLVVLRH